jgi:cystathionine gamma-lyase
MTHASVPDEQRAKLGIDDSLIRLSIGVESCRDLIDDLRNSLVVLVESMGGLK